MARFIIEGGAKLKGTIKLSGSKNSTFPVIAASLLTTDEVIINNVPKISDVTVMVQILQQLGVKVSHENNTLIINSEGISTSDLPENLTTKLRGSVVLAGALLSRFGSVTFQHPGGDVIGKRAINLHLEGFEKLGYKVEQKDKTYKASKVTSKSEDIEIYFDLPTVTGTENLILASVKRKGKTTLKNCAQEPHIIDLCKILNQMGADISGVGTSFIEIKGVEKLHGTKFNLRADDIEFGTYAIAAALTGGEITLENVVGFDTTPITNTLEKMGLKFQFNKDQVKIHAPRINSIPNLIANPWPGFPTDLMSVVIVLATQAQGISLLHDWLYESRMFFVDKLINMGAHITIADPHRVVVYGPTKLYGRDLEGPDIRAGMALVLAGLIAHGTSVINKAEHIERGYSEVVENLTKLGATIQKID